MGRPKKNPADEVKKDSGVVLTEGVMPDEKVGLADDSPELSESERPAEHTEVNAVELEEKQTTVSGGEPEETQTGASGEEPEAEQTGAPGAEPAENGKTESPGQKPETDGRVAELEAMVRQMREELADRRPQVVQVMADTEKVAMRFQSECADDNVAVFGPGGMYGQVTGKTGYVTVPKSEWSRFLTEQVRYLLDSRKLIVLSGLDDDEREMYGVNYREGELLDQRAFTKLLDLGRDLIAIFPRLCQSHQEMVASRFLSAYQKGDHRANDRDLIVALNELSKRGGRRGMFTPIIREMNAMEERD
ncbi:hypothetical protein [uncultured Dysosmobacter sp.]|uniref:hypothetical protein n=1 Tax=uncultured Dysosmobacter sp. TaxID=2591384 RepID=UPI00261EEBD0|nr:hypothetical protein [uncultured Dysosmobacter sp.]